MVDVDLYALGASLRYASGVLANVEHADEDVELLEEISSLQDALTSAINARPICEPAVLVTRVHNVVRTVLQRHPRSGVVVLPGRRPTPEPGPLGAA